MNKSFTILAGACVLLVGLPAGTLPQARAASGTFADVPADHWAYEAVDTLQKAGIVIGYPDGSYGGRRAMTRYEFAEAIARLLPLLNTDTSNFATKDELAAAQADLQNKLDANSAAIDALQQLVNGFQPELTALGVDVDAIKARLDALEARVAAVEAEQARVHITGDLNIIGRANMVSKSQDASAFDEEVPTVRSNATTGPFPFDIESFDYGDPIDQNGNVIFNGNNTNGNEPGFASNRLFQADDVYNDFLLGIRGKLDDQATANILIDFGNYLDNVGNTVSPGFFPGGPFEDFDSDGLITPGTAGPGNQQTTIWEAYLATPTGFGPLGQGNLEAGRLPIQWTKYTLKSVDADAYTDIYQIKSGNIPVDGAKADFATGPIKWDGWAGKFSDIPFAQPYLGTVGGTVGSEGLFEEYSNELDFEFLGVYPRQQLGLGLNPANHFEGVDQGAGIRGTWGKAGLDLAQYALNEALPDPDSSAESKGEILKVYNRVTVLGSDYYGPLPFVGGKTIGLDLSETETALADGSGFDNVNKGWRDAESEDQLVFNLGPKLTVEGGYRYIGPNFTSPGYWGRIGSWTDPTNIEGGEGSVVYGKGTGFTANADYEDYKTAYGTTRDDAALFSPLQEGDSVQRFQAGIGKSLGKRDDVSAAYEDDQYDLKGEDMSFVRPGHPSQTFLTLGWNHTVNRNTTWKLLYQAFSYDDDGTGFFGGFGPGTYDTSGESGLEFFTLPTLHTLSGSTVESQVDMHF